MRFVPPTEDRLADADIADCEYQSVVSEIIGVVSPRSQGGWPRTDEYMIHSFEFAAWRKVDSDTLNSELTVLRPVPVDSNFFGVYGEGDIMRMRVLLSVDLERAVVAEVIDTRADVPELRAVADELAKPVEIQTERFGTLVLDRRINWFSGTAVWSGKEVEITFDASADLDINTQLETARSLFEAEKEWQRKLDLYVVKELLSAANDWQEEGSMPISEQDFLDCMELEAISIKPDGEFEFWHSDGDLFYGHSILLEGSLDEGFTSADIAG